MNIIITLPEDNEPDIVLSSPPYTMRLAENWEIQIVPMEHGAILRSSVYYVKEVNGKMIVYQFDVTENGTRSRKQFESGGILIECGNL